MNMHQNIEDAKHIVSPLFKR